MVHCNRKNFVATLFLQKCINVLLIFGFLVICEIVATGQDHNEIQFNIHLYASCLNRSLNNQLLRNGEQLTRSYLEV